MLNAKEELKKQVIELCINGKMTVKAAAVRLNLSERQVKNLKARYKKIGVSSVLHGNCGRQPKQTLSPEVKQKIVEIKSEESYSTINFLHFQEDLESEYGIKISYSALRSLLMSIGTKSPKSRRKRKVKHPRRERKERFGEMLQTDATPFDWFGTGETFALHAFIDDATGKLTGLFVRKNECAQGYLGIMRQTISRFGIPQSIYADGLSLFFSTAKPTVEEQLQGKTTGQTQFGRIMESIGCHMIHARSPQAKGRVERLWETLQSRLPVEFAKRGIKNVEAANAFLENEYLAQFNERFGKTPTKEETAFMKRPKGLVLDTLLSMRYMRTVDNSGCFSFDGVICQSNIRGIMPNAKVEILINARLGVRIMYKDRLYTPTPILDKKKRQVTGSSIKAIFAQFIWENCLKNEHVA
jgi:transposase